MPGTFAPGDFVFAKVKGFPPWPARITGIPVAGKYSVFFYGTYETANVKKNEVWEFNQENEDQFVQKNLHRRGYAEGMEEIRTTPEIAPSATSEIVMVAVPKKPAKKTPQPQKTVSQKIGGNMVDGTFKSPITSKPLLRKPVRFDDGSPVKPRTSFGTPPSTDSAPKRRSVVKRASQDESVAPSSTGGETGSETPPVSRSGRLIKQRRLSGEGKPNSNTDSPNVATAKHNAETQIEGPRKIWVKLKNSDDLIEINLDKDRPERWQSNEERLQWQLGTARNAIKFKRGVETGRFIPEEVGEAIRRKAELTPDEKELLKKEAELLARKKKIAWLKLEQDMVETEMSIKSCLKSEAPQTDRCLQLMHSFLQLKVEKLMILKQPGVADTIRRLRKYVGPTDISSYSDKDKERLQRNVKLIQTKGETMYNKLKALFQFKETPVPGEKERFPTFLAAQVDKFKKDTAGMEELKLLALTEYPK